MKKRVIASLVLMSAGALVAGSAMALNPQAPTRELRIAGSTAGQPGLLGIAMELCSANITVYTSGDDPTTGALSAVLCTDGSGSLSVQHSANGAGAATVALLEGTPLPYFDWAAMQALGGTFGCAAPSNTTVMGVAATLYTGCGGSTQTTAPPVAVLSDVDTARFNSISIVVGTKREALEDRITSQRVYGLAVTEKLYKILQANQFPGDTHQCNPNSDLYSQVKSSEIDPTTGAAATYTYGDSPACRPNLGGSQVRALLSDTGEIAGWGGVDYVGGGTNIFYGFQDNAAGTLGYTDKNGTRVDCSSTEAGWGGSAATAYNENFDGTSNEAVFVCAGARSTGLSAVAEIHYMRQRCQSPSDSLCVEGGDFSDTASVGLRTVSDYEGDANFRNARCHFSDSVTGIEGCMKAHASAGSCAVAPMPVNKSATGYRFIKVDGGHPSIVDAFKGKTDNIYTSVISRIKDVVPAKVGPVAGVKASATEKAVFNSIVDAYKTRPDVIARNNNQPQLTMFGYQSGEMVNPTPFEVEPLTTSTSDSLAADVIARPVSTTDRTGGGVSANNCLPTRKLYRQPVK